MRGEPCQNNFIAHTELGSADQGLQRGDNAALPIDQGAVTIETEYFEARQVHANAPQSPLAAVSYSHARTPAASTNTSGTRNPAPPMERATRIPSSSVIPSPMKTGRRPRNGGLVIRRATASPLSTPRGRTSHIMCPCIRKKSWES